VWGVLVRCWRSSQAVDSESFWSIHLCRGNETRWSGRSLVCSFLDLTGSSNLEGDKTFRRLGDGKAKQWNEAVGWGLVDAFPSIQGPRNLFWVLTLRRVKVFETWDSPRRPIRGPLINGPHQAPTSSSDTTSWREILDENSVCSVTSKRGRASFH